MSLTSLNKQAKQGCHQIRKFRESQETFSIREIRGKGKSFQKIIATDDVLHAQSHIMLSVMRAQFYPFAYHSVLCSHYEAQFRFVMNPKV